MGETCGRAEKGREKHDAGLEEMALFLSLSCPLQMLEVAAYYMQLRCAEVDNCADWFTAARIMDAVWQVAHRWTKLWSGVTWLPFGSGGLEDSPHTR